MNWRTACRITLWLYAHAGITPKKIPILLGVAWGLGAWFGVKARMLMPRSFSRGNVADPTWSGSLWFSLASIVVASLVLLPLTWLPAVLDVAAFATGICYWAAKVGCAFNGCCGVVQHGAHEVRSGPSLAVIEVRLTIATLTLTFALLLMDFPAGVVYLVFGVAHLTLRSWAYRRREQRQRRRPLWGLSALPGLVPWVGVFALSLL
jgi:hypothetical protein